MSTAEVKNTRLLFILEEVKNTEHLPVNEAALSPEEEAELLGRDKLIWDWDRPYLQHYYWLTEKGMSQLAELREWLASLPPEEDGTPCPAITGNYVWSSD